MRRRAAPLCAAGVLVFLALFLISTLFYPFTRTQASENNQTSEVTRPGHHIRVQPVAHGDSSIKLRDGQELLTSYVGSADLRAALEQNLAEPLSLASADFDEDGVPDLIGGYANRQSGIVTLHRGMSMRFIQIPWKRRRAGKS